VTHDRWFLDNVCDEIIEMEFGEFTRFKGNYSWYVEKKAELEEVRSATQQHLRGLMRSELEWVRKMPRARGTKSKSRLQAFDVLKEQATRKFDHGQVSIDIQTSRLGGKVIEARNLTKNFGAKKIVEHFNYSSRPATASASWGPTASARAPSSTCSPKGPSPMPAK
jgi:ATP-binding cassette subfamily F protein uup